MCFPLVGTLFKSYFKIYQYLLPVYNFGWIKINIHLGMHEICQMTRSQ